MNELKSYTEYAVSTPTADFVIGFDFNYGDDAVNVTVDDVPAPTAGYTVVYLNETTIRLSPSVPSGVVRLQRETDIDQTDHVYRAGAKFIAQTMDENFEQLRHSQQEVRDGFYKLSDDTYAIIDTLEDVAQSAQDAADDANAAAQVANDAAAQVADKVSQSELSSALQPIEQDLTTIKRYTPLPYIVGKNYEVGERVTLSTGEVVENLVPNNNVNPNTDMLGWRKGVDASDVKDESGLSQQEINNFQKERFIFLEDFGAVEGGDNTTAFRGALLKAKELGGGVVTTNIKNHSITDQVIYFDDTIIDLRGATVNTSSSFCNALYNSARTEYTGHYGAEGYYRYQQALNAGVPFSKFEYSSVQGDLVIRVLNASEFRIGDTVMINNGYCDMWRVMESNEATNAHIWNRDDVPLWKCEFATITNISGNTISLDSKLKHNYPLTPLTTGIFLDENSKSEYASWNTPSIIKLNGASNVTFRNVNFKRSNASSFKMLNALLATNIVFEDCTFNGTGFGAEITSCVSSSIKGCNSKTERFGLQLRRSYLSSIQGCTGYLTGSDDAPIIMWEGCHDSYADGINSISAEGFVGANIGFYINTSWDCHASRITANNAETVLEISFSHNCTADRIYGDNCTYILSNFCVRNISASRMNLRSQKNKSATSSDNGLIATRYSNNVKYSEIESQGTGRYLIIKSFGVSVCEMITPNFNIYTEDQIAVAYKTHMPYLKVDSSTFDEFAFATSGATIHNDRNVVIKDCSISKSVYLVNKANSEVWNTKIAGNGVDSGLSLKSSYYTRIHNSQIGGNLQSIDFAVWGGVDINSSAIYIENTLLSAPNKFKDYTVLDNYLEFMSPLNKGLQYISNLSDYPQISLYANNSGDGGTVWQPVSVSRNDVAWTFSERLSSATNSINTVNKYIGRTVFNDTTGKFMMSSGSTPTSAWLATDNSESITPV